MAYVLFLLLLFSTYNTNFRKDDFMTNPFNKKIADMLGKMDEKVLKARLNAAVEMLQKGNTEELAKKINKSDKDELISKINEIDQSNLESLNINKDDLRQKINDADLQKLSELIGDRGDEIIIKLKTLLDKS